MSLRILCGVLVVSSAVAHAADEAARALELLKRTEAAYTGITGYTIDIEERRAASATHLLGSRDASLAPLEPLNGPVNRITITRSGRMFLYESDSPARRVRWINNGETMWLYRSDVNEYTEERAASSEIPSASGGGLSAIEWRLFAKFRAIASVAPRAAVMRELPASETCGPAALVAIDLSQLPEPVNEELSIDTKTGLVCEATTRVLRHIGVTPSQYLTHTVWRYRQLFAPDSSVFQFYPPKGAKRVNRFHRPM